MAQLPCFEELRDLAERDPEAFEAFREAACQEFIDSIPDSHQPRLRAVQFRVDRVIERAKTPLAGLIKVSGMMHDSLFSLSEKLHDLSKAPYHSGRAPLLKQSNYPRQEPIRRDNVIDLESWRRLKLI